MTNTHTHTERYIIMMIKKFATFPLLFIVVWSDWGVEVDMWPQSRDNEPLNWGLCIYSLKKKENL